MKIQQKFYIIYWLKNWRKVSEIVLLLQDKIKRERERKTGALVLRLKLNNAPYHVRGNNPRPSQYKRQKQSSRDGL